MKFAVFLRDVFDAVNTPGGHMLICLALMITYARAQTTGLEHDIAVFAMGVLSRSMGTATAPAMSSISSRTVTTVIPEKAEPTPPTVEPVKPEDKA